MSPTWKPDEAHWCCYSCVCLLAFRTYQNQTGLCVMWRDQEARCVSGRRARMNQWLWSHARGYEGEHLCISHFQLFNSIFNDCSAAAKDKRAQALLESRQRCWILVIAWVTLLFCSEILGKHVTSANLTNRNKKKERAIITWEVTIDLQHVAWINPVLWETLHEAVRAVYTIELNFQIW